jgi:hypothetical protein
MEEAPGNGKESSHSAHSNGMNERRTFKKFSFGCFNHGIFSLGYIILIHWVTWLVHYFTIIDVIEMYYYSYLLLQFPVATLSKPWIYGWSLAGNAVSIPISSMDVYLECCVGLLSDRGPWDGWPLFHRSPTDRGLSECDRETLLKAVASWGKNACYYFFEAVISGSLSPQHGVSSGCGWRSGLQYGA